MATDQRTIIEAASRDERGSRESRRMRKNGRLPGILYGRGRDPQAFSVDLLELRAALKGGQALFDVKLGNDTVPVIVKDHQQHPVRGDYTHIDLLEVDLKKKILSPVVIELTGVEDAPGVVQGGVLDQVTRELQVEALPTDIPDSIVIDVSHLEIHTTLVLAEVEIAAELTVLDDPQETVIATVLPPTKVEVETEVEEETELVGEAAEEAEAEASEDEGNE